MGAAEDPSVGMDALGAYLDDALNGALGGGRGARGFLGAAPRSSMILCSSSAEARSTSADGLADPCLEGCAKGSTGTDNMG